MEFHWRSRMMSFRNRFASISVSTNAFRECKGRQCWLFWIVDACGLSAPLFRWNVREMAGRTVPVDWHHPNRTSCLISHVLGRCGPYGTAVSDDPSVCGGPRSVHIRYATSKQSNPGYAGDVGRQEVSCPQRWEFSNELDNISNIRPNGCLVAIRPFNYG